MFHRSKFSFVVSFVFAVIALGTIGLLLNRSVWAMRPQAIITVNPGGSIQTAINSANAGDTIVVQPGIYTESLTLNKPVSLTGQSANTTIIRAISGQRVLTITPSIVYNHAPLNVIDLTVASQVVISGLTFANGNATSGGLCPNACGGGILIDTNNSIQPHFQNVIINNNHANQYGGGLYQAANSPLTFSNVTVNNNTADGEGGGLYGLANVTITGGRFQGNSTPGQGGGAEVTNGAATLVGTIFLSNTSGSAGAGLSSVFNNNALQDVQFIANHAGNYGDGWYTYIATATMSGGYFERNTAQQAGGAIENEGILTLTNVLIYSNTAIATAYPAYGGGIDNERAGNGMGYLIVSNSKIYANKVVTGDVNYAGAGIYSWGDFSQPTIGTARVTILNSAIYSNSTLIGPGGGINADISTTLIIVNSTIANNSAQFGAGLFVTDTASAMITNSTFYNNQASGSGGNIQATDGLVLRANAPAYPPDCLSPTCVVPNVTVFNTLIGAGTPANCAGYIDTYGNNLESSNTCGLGAAGDQVNTNPLLGAFQNGYYALQSTSPAIDAGNNTGCPATDQRGFKRPLDGDGNSSQVCDIGAVEYPDHFLFLPLTIKNF